MDLNERIFAPPPDTLNAIRSFFPQGVQVGWMLAPGLLRFGEEAGARLLLEEPRRQGHRRRSVDPLYTLGEHQRWRLDMQATWLPLRGIH